MSIDAFDSGYWYAVELKAFVRELGLTGTSSLRKDQLEAEIKHFLEYGQFKKKRAAGRRSK